MNGIKVTLDKVKIDNSIDMAKMLLRFITTAKSLKLSETELHIMSIFVTEGYSEFTKEKLITVRLVKDKKILANILNRFRKIGVLVKTTLGEQLSKDYNIPLSNVDALKIELVIVK